VLRVLHLAGRIVPATWDSPKVAGGQYKWDVPNGGWS
jgi:hypothetical protein